MEPRPTRAVVADGLVGSAVVLIVGLLTGRAAWPTVGAAILPASLGALGWAAAHVL